MIQNITTWALLLSLSPKCSQLPSPMVLEIFILPLLKHRFWTFLLFAMGFRLWTIPDLCKNSFTFPDIFPDATCSSHLLPCFIPLAQQLDQSTPPAAEGIPSSCLREENLSHPAAQGPLITPPLGSPSSVNVYVSLQVTWIKLCPSVSVELSGCVKKHIGDFGITLFTPNLCGLPSSPLQDLFLVLLVCWHSLPSVSNKKLGTDLCLFWEYSYLAVTVSLGSHCDSVPSSLVSRCLCFSFLFFIPANCRHLHEKRYRALVM